MGTSGSGRGAPAGEDGEAEGEDGGGEEGVAQVDREAAPELRAPGVPVPVARGGVPAGEVRRRAALPRGRGSRRATVRRWSSTTWPGAAPGRPATSPPTPRLRGASVVGGEDRGAVREGREELQPRRRAGTRDPARRRRRRPSPPARRRSRSGARAPAAAPPRPGCRCAGTRAPGAPRRRPAAPRWAGALRRWSGSGRARGRDQDPAPAVAEDHHRGVEGREREQDGHDAVAGSSAFLFFPTMRATMMPTS